ncbi:MAG: DUF1501 domain-containing protein [Isosphaeraceae bacterium]
MLTTGSGQGDRDRQPPRDVTRRGFLQAGAAAGTIGALPLGTSPARARAAVPSSEERSVILLMLVGGPSQLETFDPKPDAPAEIRGPFGSIPTSVPGVRINEYLPKLARRMNRVTLVRSLHHDAAPIHETGMQLLQTGRLERLGDEAPHAGAVAARLLGPRGDAPPFAILPGPVGNTGVGISHGQGAAGLGPRFEAFHLNDDPTQRDFDGVEAARRLRRFLGSTSGRPSRDLSPIFDLERESVATRDAYGRTAFGQNCLLARRLVEAGSRLVTVNMTPTVFHRVSWDCHGSAPFSTLDDYRRELLPTLDSAVSALLDDLDQTGRLESTLVVAVGEFGRTPKLNMAGGRDHWPGVWTALLAGGGMPGGQVIGASDAHAAEPADRPVRPAELLATIYRGLGIDPSRTLALADGSSHALVPPGSAGASLLA